MSFWDFLKEKAILLFVHLAAVAFMAVMLLTLQINTYAIVFLCGLFLLADCFAVVLEYLKKFKYYRDLTDISEQLEQKYLLSEMVDCPDFLEGKLFFEVLRRCNKSMSDEVAKHRQRSDDYREYIELWMHEVKTPIASARLILENNRSQWSAEVEQELDSVDYYLDQALFYSRSGSVEKDYIIKAQTLREIVGSAVRKNARTLIRAGITPELHLGDVEIYTDIKWTDFILTQLLVNASKYRSENPILRIVSQEEKQSVILSVEDNGIGISPSDLPRVFEKGYTGATGRSYAKSTGMGLYLCKTLCDKLGLGLSISSKQGKGTTVRIAFPKSAMFLQ